MMMLVRFSMPEVWCFYISFNTCFDYAFSANVDTFKNFFFSFIWKIVISFSYLFFVCKIQFYIFIK